MTYFSRFFSGTAVLRRLMIPPYNVSYLKNWCVGERRLVTSAYFAWLTLCCLDADREGQFVKVRMFGACCSYIIASMRGVVESSSPLPRR